MSKLPIKIMVEKAFAEDFLPRVVSISGLRIYQGHEEKPEEFIIPSLTVYGEDSQEHGDMPTGTGVRVVRLRLKFTVEATPARAKLDEWKDQVECAILDVTRMQEILNAPASGIDRRKVTGIHFHDIQIGGDPSALEETEWVEDQIFDVVVERL